MLPFPPNFGAGSWQSVLMLLPLALPALLGPLLRLRKRRAARVLDSRLQVGARVVTSGGLHGTIAGLRDTIVELETCSGTVQFHDRSAIARLLDGA